MSPRLRTATGGRIDRTKTLRFTFDGREYAGLRGDTLASALIANGVHLVGRSFKYHRPRGFLSAATEEPNALVTVVRDAARSTPNIPATDVELYDGLVAMSQNRWPSLSFDMGRVNDYLGRFMPAGFYYKTFMWPRGAWRSLYEPLIRAAAGLGRAPEEADTDYYSHRYAHCDVLVAGAGPAGLSAALTAARSGLSVLLCERQAECGGSLLSDRSARIDGEAADAWCERALQELAGLPRVTVLTRTTAFGYFAHNMIGLSERLTDHLARPAEHLPRERLWQVRAKEVILAAGALERPLVFPGNDRPGIMLADAARTYLNRYGVIAGQTVVLVTAHDAAYRAAIELHAAGARVAAIADTRAAAAGPLPRAARELGLALRARSTVLGTTGGRHVRSVTLAQLDDSRTRVSEARQTVVCDLLLMSGGFTPNVHLFSQSRGQLAWEGGAQAFVPATPAERTHAAGACRGVFDLGRAIEDGAEAAMRAARSLGTSAVKPCLSRVECDSSEPGGFIGALPQPAGRERGKAFVDWQSDVTVHDLRLAVREGFRSIEHVKRYTTAGMATDQGKTSNLNALGIAARELGRAVADVGLTTFRMPYTPVTFGTLSAHARGDLFDPVRRTPLHEWSAARGAVFENLGLWKRALHFPLANEHASRAIARECHAVRNACGLFDASTLGKIEVVGPDAAELLNRLYVNDLSTLGIGRCRYGVLLRDDGYVFDDGVIARIAADRFHVTTTTAGAARVLALMEDYRQTEWMDLKVWLTSTTEQWAVLALQGPKARSVLQPHIEGIDLSAGALPHMSIARGRIFGVPLLLFRVSFTGELGFELNVPADCAEYVCELLFAAGESLALTPYGTEAMRLLRAEKGYVIVGQDTDGTVSAEDAGLGWAVSNNKPDFLGKRSLSRPALRDPSRKQLVGLLTADGTTLLEEGAQIAERSGQHPPRPVIGHVTSSYRSEAVGRPIALALVSAGRSRAGQTLFVPMNGREVPVCITSPVFYDPKGERLHV
jgi:sarcosine oxidase subunit alpha